MTPTPGTTVWIERRKWKDTPHYGAQAVFLGEDEHGRWAGTLPGNRCYKANGPEWIGTYPTVWCLPRDGWFLAHHLVGHAEVDIYIDIAAPAVWSDRGATLVDLDLDVLVWNDGRPVELVDEDEFELHRVELAYPDEIVAAARAAAAEILEQATAGDPPFDRATAAPWLRALEGLDR